MTQKPKREPSTYVLRGIPRETWKRLKLRAVGEGRTIREVLLSFVTAYAGGLR